jgi:hypothetical protein
MAYLSLSTANLPDPVIDPAQGSSPEDYFNTVLYTGDGTNGKSITGVGFQTDFNWTKSRSSASYSHQLSDAVRGFTKYLYSNATTAEGTDASNHIQSVNSDGYVINSGASFNASGVTYVAWNWKANGTGVSNTDGSITSTVSANTTSGFSIVGWLGTQTNSTIGHGLTQAPEMIIVKSRGSAEGWFTYHKDVGNTSRVLLNSTTTPYASVEYWNNTSPTSSVFTVGINDGTNDNGFNMIAYCFHSVEGFSKFGSYTGNNQTDAGPFVYLGFRPAFLLLKNTGSANWHLIDAKRSPYNEATEYLEPNASDAETDTTNHGVDILSNGFRPMTTAGFGEINGSGDTIIYMAFAENPFKYSNAR